MFKDILLRANISIESCSKNSSVSKRKIIKLQKDDKYLVKLSDRELELLAKTFNMPKDTFIMSVNMPHRQEFELFKSEMCHKLKSKGDIKFVAYLLKENLVPKYWKAKWYAESLYCLAMLDQLSKEKNVPLFKAYDFYRQQKLKNILYPKDIELISLIDKNAKHKERVLKECNPEFLKYNIVEGDIRNVT